MVAEIAEDSVGRRTAPEKLRWSSSKANIVPARGAFNAAARPALAPLVMRYRSDVYKRQAFEETVIDEGGAYFHGGRLGYKVIDISDEIMAGHVPVSYTHLDVYKRQGRY